MKQRDQNTRGGIGVDLFAQLSISLRLGNCARKQLQRLVDSSPDQPEHFGIAQSLGPYVNSQPALLSFSRFIERVIKASDEQVEVFGPLSARECLLDELFFAVVALVGERLD